MNNSKLVLLSTVLLLTCTHVHAVLFHYDGITIISDRQNSLHRGYFPDGAILTVSLDLEVGPGTPLTSSLTNGAGTVTWNDPFNRTFNVSEVLRGGLASFRNTYEMNFDGLGPSIGGKQMVRFWLGIELEENPFTTSTELVDLLRMGTPYRNGVGVV